MARVIEAVLEEKSAALSSDFGRAFAERVFGAEKLAAAMEACGTWSRGPLKGQPAGRVVWSKVIKGGYAWSKYVVSDSGSPASGAESWKARVIRPGRAVRVAILNRRGFAVLASEELL